MSKFTSNTLNIIHEFIFVLFLKVCVASPVKDSLIFICFSLIGIVKWWNAITIVQKNKYSNVMCQSCLHALEISAYFKLISVPYFCLIRCVFSFFQRYLLDNKIDSALWLTRVFTIISSILYLLPLFRYVISTHWQLFFGQACCWGAPKPIIFFLLKWIFAPVRNALQPFFPISNNPAAL